MEADFYAGRLRERHGLTVRVPGEADRAELHRIIYEELVVGVIDSTSKQRVVDMVERCVVDGATGVIAGCTEIELLIGPDDVPVEFLPTARLHALAAVDRAFAD
jgi:aspartate racemase